MQIQDKNTQTLSNLGKFQADRQTIVKQNSSEVAKLEMNLKDDFQNGTAFCDDMCPTMLGPGMEQVMARASFFPSSSKDLSDYMIPDNEGRVKHMCMTMGIVGNARENYLDAVKTLVTGMPQAKFTILASGVNNSQDLKDSLKQWTRDGLVDNPDRVNIVQTHAQVSIWAQDSLLVSGNKVVEQDRKWFPGWGDREVAGEVARVNPDLEHQKLEGVFIDGGNQRATRDKIFVGSDAVAFALDDMKQYPSKYYKIASNVNLPEAKSMPKEELIKGIMDRSFPHQKIVIVGHKGEQPAFHIDMAVTPLGKKHPESGKPVMIVGDPKMAIDILSDLKTTNPSKYDKYQKEMCKKVQYCEKKPLDRMIKQAEKEPDIQENFDALAKGFEQNGYHVERVPYLGSSNLSRTPWVTYNNSVIDGDNVFIPNFEIPELDQTGNAAYEKFGYKPIPIDMTNISSLQGAINCITKVVEREYES